MTASPRELMDAAAEVARLAGSVAARHFRSRVLAVERKRDGTEVTMADREAERAARDWIERRFPGDGILGEEFGETRPDARRRWILDPIDGTASFVRGAPLWGTLVAVAEAEDVLAGCIYCPAVDELVVAAPAEGCWWNDARCAVSPTARVGEATVLTTDERFRATGREVLEERVAGWRALAARAAVARTWGDCFGYLMVATGRAEVMADAVMSPWDSAVMLPIVEEAGGVFTDWTGRRTAFGGSAIATNLVLADEARALLRGAGGGAEDR